MGSGYFYAGGNRRSSWSTVAIYQSQILRRYYRLIKQIIWRNRLVWGGNWDWKSYNGHVSWLAATYFQGFEVELYLEGLWDARYLCYLWRVFKNWTRGYWADAVGWLLSITWHWRGVLSLAISLYYKQINGRRSLREWIPTWTETMMPIETRVSIIPLIKARLLLVVLGLRTSQVSFQEGIIKLECAYY